LVKTQKKKEEEIFADQDGQPFGGCKSRGKLANARQVESEESGEKVARGFAPKWGTQPLGGRTGGVTRRFKKRRHGKKLQGIRGGGRGDAFDLKAFRQGEVTRH